MNRTTDVEAPLEVPFTRWFKGRGELIDHIFASHRLVNPANLPVARAERNLDPSSDHAAVVATFTLCFVRVVDHWQQSN